MAETSTTTIFLRGAEIRELEFRKVVRLGIACVTGWIIAHLRGKSRVANGISKAKRRPPVEDRRSLVGSVNGSENLHCLGMTQSELP
jgi:hypothetical protein